MAVVTLEKEIARKLDTLDKSKRRRDPSSDIRYRIVDGTHKDTKITLARIIFDDEQREGVFIYPVNLLEEFELQKLRDIDSRFDKVEKVFSKRFEDKSIEEVSNVFVELAKRAGLMSAMTFYHPNYRPRMMEHAFRVGTYVILWDVVNDLRV